MFEESEKVGAMLGQMRSIVKETSYWAFRHRKCEGEEGGNGSFKLPKRSARMVWDSYVFGGGGSGNGFVMY
jgi:hypothetical protein